MTGGGLTFKVTSPESAQWLYKYSRHGRETSIGLGGYPSITLKRARELHMFYRSQKAEGKDPVAVKREREGRERHVWRTLETIAQEYFDTVRQHELKGGGVAGRWWSPVKLHVLPRLGRKTLRDLTVDDIVANFQHEGLWHKKRSTAEKAFSRMAQILRYGKSEMEPFDLTKLEAARAKLGKPKHVAVSHRALPWQDVPAMFKEIPDTSMGRALQLMLLTVARTAMVRFAKPEEFDTEAMLWTLAPERMKTEQPFRLPLPPQALPLLQGQRDDSGYLFTSDYKQKNPTLSENAFTNYFKRKGIPATGHGFRSTFTDWALENGICDIQTADMCLAHQTKSKVQAAYFRSDMLQVRREVMGLWADYITGESAHDRAFRKIREASDTDHEKEMRAILRDAEHGGPMTPTELGRWYRDSLEKADILDEPTFSPDDRDKG
ncbi:protein of unknown function [Palleronia salina]|uniref:Tyr recombinase domain-containing protein n=1 Tax=Palleronia salina TaxID=313368 RepID=A0A1M6B106_9RHOB|nr:protein of unknown function [Palleronia salina]